MSNDNALNESPNPIQHSVDIDEMLLKIAAVDEQIEHYKNLKKHRTQAIDSEIERLNNHRTQYRCAIQQFMAAEGEKTLNYPGVGKVSRKAGTRTWVIKDEGALLSYLKNNSSISPQSIGKIIVTEEKIVKKELNRLLDDLNAHSALQTDSVALEASVESISISFEKGDSLLTATRDIRSNLLESPTLSEQPAADSSPNSFDALDIF